MRLDAAALRYLNDADWRVLTAVETGSRNHEFVPTPLIASLAGHRSGSVGDVQRSISSLAKIGLISRGGSKGKGKAAGDGYRLTYGGLDYLALHALEKMGVVSGLGSRIGVGKESDIFDVVLPEQEGKQRRGVLKIHRLGRVSFKKGVRRKREYGKGPRQPGSWMHMSRLAATKEFAFMKALGDVEKIRVPRAVAHNRHMVVMEFVDGAVLRSVLEVGLHNRAAGQLYGDLMEAILTLAGVGLIHGDFNEFNIILREEGIDPAQTEMGQESEINVVPVIIDFPQMVSVDHPNAEFYYQRDVDCVKRFFERKFKYVSNSTGPLWQEAKILVGQTRGRRIDVEVEASGFSRKMARELETYMKEHGIDGHNGEQDDQDERDAEDTEDSNEEDDEQDDHDTQRDGHST